MIYQQIHSRNADYFTVERSENLTFPLHMHSSFEVIAAESGEMTVQVDSAEYLLKAGDVIFIFPYQIHSIVTKTKSRNTLCIFSGDVVSHFYCTAKGTIPQNPVINMKNTPELTLFLEASADNDLAKIKGLMYLMCTKLTESTVLVSKTDAQSSHLELLDRIFRFVNDNLTDSCSLKDLSIALMYDYAYISKVFSGFVGMPFNRYINRLRISEACHMLRNTDQSVISISENCGYSSLRSFNRNFQRIMNTTPSEYRRMKFNPVFPGNN